MHADFRHAYFTKITAIIININIPHKQYSKPFKMSLLVMLIQEILVDCDQFNILLARIIFSCVFLSVFLFLSVCTKDSASN